MESQLWIILMELHAINPTRAMLIARAYDEIGDDIPASAELMLAISDARTYLYANGYFPDCQECGGWVFPDNAAKHAEHAAAEAANGNTLEETNTDDEIDNDESDDGRYPDDDAIPSTADIYGQALAHFKGDHAQAAEAASMYPGDFIR